MGGLRIETMVLGAVATNSYLAVNEESREALLIDPAGQEEVIIQKIRALDIKPVAILLTHGHFDHIGAAAKLKREFQVPIYAMQSEKVILEDANLNLSEMFGLPFTVSGDSFVQDEQRLNLAGFEIEVIHTPGHTKGSVCYYLPNENVLFSGDTLFWESVGRTDFPTGNARHLTESVQKLLKILPEDTAVYPGHEAETSIGHEKMCNPFA